MTSGVAAGRTLPTRDQRAQRTSGLIGVGHGDVV